MAERRKRCARCGRVRRASHFYAKSDGTLSSWCRDCTRAAMNYRRRAARAEREKEVYRGRALRGPLRRPPRDGNGRVCEKCSDISICRDRVAGDMLLPVLCEYVDEADLLRARLMHGALAEALLGLEAWASDAQSLARVHKVARAGR